MNDADAGVRESALWAYGFVGGNIAELVTKLESFEEDKNVLSFAMQLKNLSPVEFWFI